MVRRGQRPESALAPFPTARGIGALHSERRAPRASPGSKKSKFCSSLARRSPRSRGNLGASAPASGAMEERASCFAGAQRHGAQGEYARPFRGISVAALGRSVQVRPPAVRRDQQQGYAGSYSNLARLLAAWKDPDGSLERRRRSAFRVIAVKIVGARLQRVLEGARNRSNECRRTSPLTAAVLCVKPRSK